MKKFIEEYGSVLFIAVIIVVLMSLVTPMGSTIKTFLYRAVNKFIEDYNPTA